MAFSLFADYPVTVQHGPQALFQHPVSVELTAEQTAFFVQTDIWSLRIIFIGFLTPIVLYEALRLLRQWLLWSFNGLGHFKSPQACSI
ncbi:MAG: hypothetical protein J5654_10280 [Victivallales bacterium]|nr:hypothetical protein [Victivallales bacterium]